MNKEVYGGEDQKPGLVMSQENSAETTDDWAREHYNVTRYTFQREGAVGEGDPYVQVEMRDTGADMAFSAQGAQRRTQDGTVPVGTTSELAYEVQAKLDDQQASAIAGRLADLMFDISQIEI